MNMFTIGAIRGGRALAFFAMIALLFSLVPAIQLAQADHDPYGGIELEKVVVCHWDASDAYKSSGDLSVNAINGHTNPAHKYDIIAPFHYDGGEFAGQNWNGWDDGAPAPEYENQDPQDIWADCVGPLVLTGTIIVDKVTNPVADPQSFLFTTTGSNYTGFSLTDASAPNSQQLNAGTYSVAETAVGGWTQTNVACVSSLGGSENPASIGLTIGETVTCTFTNTKDVAPVLGCTDPGATNYDPAATEDDGSCEYPPVEMPTITVTKQTEPNGDQTEFQFYMDDEPQSFATLSDGESSTAQTVATGTQIEIFEGLIQDWELTSVTCLDDDQQDVVASTTVDGVIIEALSEGDDVTCVFTNTNTTIPTFNVSGSKFDWDSEQGLEGWVIEIYNDGAEVPFATTSTDVDGNYTFSGIANGPYIVCEVGQDGWEQMLPDTVSGCYSVEVDDENVIDRDFWNRQLPSETIQMCKYDELEQPVSGWGMTLTNDTEEGTYNLVTGEDGCVYQDVNPEDGPWYVLEEERGGWTFLNAEAFGGNVIGTQSENVDACEFFAPINEQVSLLAILVDDVQDNHRCNFYNERPAENDLACTLTVNDNNVEDGTEVTLEWTTNNATDASIDQGIGAVDLNGSTQFTIENDITFTLTASNSETEESVNCQVSVNEDNGGGGGGGGKKIELRDEDPEPEVLGEQTEILPAGAPNAGMGGAAATGGSTLFALFTLIASAFATRRLGN